MKRRLAIALVVPGFAAIFGVAIGAGYFLGQTSFRPSLPPPGLAMPSTPTPGTSAPTGSDSGPGGAESSSSPADQPGSGEAPQGPPPAPQATPSPRAGGGQQQPTPSPSPNPTPAGPAVLPAIPAPPSRFHVQAGVFGDRDNAATLVKQLRDRGYAVTLVEGPPFRVWVGGYLDRATADRLAANLQAAGFEATVTPR